MPICCRSDFKQAVLQQLKDKEDEAQRQSKHGRKAILRLGGTGMDHGCILLVNEHLHEDVPSTD